MSGHEERYRSRAIAWAAADAWRVVAGLEHFGSGNSPWDSFATATLLLDYANGAGPVTAPEGWYAARALVDAIGIFDLWVSDGYALDITVEAARESRERLAEYRERERAAAVASDAGQE